MRAPTTDRLRTVIHAPAKRITLKDIAREAGVATGTVSMVLNDSPRVADATRSHVQHVIRDLGYVYDRGAGQLRSKHSHLVGVAVCNLVNPCMAEVTASLQQAMQDLGHLLILGNCAESVPRQQRFLEKLREYKVEGLLLTPAAGTPKTHVARLRDWRVPVVQVLRYVPGAPTDFVGGDHRLGAAMATRHLLALGHQRIAFVGLDPLSIAAREGFAGFLTALAEAGQTPDADLVLPGPATREAGYLAMAPLHALARPPTALVCVDPLIAFGALRGLVQLGIEPGRDCSVIALDDVAEAALCHPPLTAMAFDLDCIGRAASRLLSERIVAPDHAVEHLVLQPRLVVRSSCGKPRAVRRLNTARPR